MTNARTRPTLFDFPAVACVRLRLRFLVAVVALCIVALPSASIAAPAVLYSFTAASAPSSGLILGSDGALYGTTLHGGAYGAGSIFRMPASGGTLSNLYSFMPATNSVGAVVYDLGPNELAQGPNGDFYGTTSQGGTNFSGTIFMVAPSGAFTNLYTFLDGEMPTGSLVLGTDGNFYGTTEYGGANGTGTIFQITSAGAFTILYSFGKTVAGSSSENGTVPNALVLGSNGVFYGTTQQGGINNAGTFFKFSVTGGFSQISSFNGGASGGNPITPDGALVQGTNGDFYGTSRFGGSQGGGTIFEFTNTAGVNVLHSFPLLNAGGAAALTLAAAGDFYGTTSANGLNGNGTLFKMTAAGEFSYYSFPGLNSNSDNAAGADPSGVLAADNANNLYGTCAAGGTNGSGIIFQIYTPTFIPPFFVPETNPPPTQTNMLTGASLTLSYSAQGLAPLTYQWLMGGLPITNGSDFLGAQSNALVINPVLGRDVGNYSLVISNTWGPLTSSVTALTVTPPSVSISSPAPGASISTPVFSGTATNSPLFPNANINGIQLLVTYSITNTFNGSNISGFAALTSGSGGASNWSITAAPYPGTNVLTVQSVDSSGNISLPAVRTFFYAVPAPLTINTIGSGSASFNLTNGAMLDIGRTYSVTVQPNSSLFLDWVNNGLITFTGTLQFIMQSNLVLTADLLARQPPAVSISFPAPNVRTRSNLFQGTAASSPVLPGVNSNAVRLDSVFYWITNIASKSVSQGLALLAPGAGSVSNWSIAANPLPGSNVLVVEAKDVSGNTSPLLSRTFFFKVPSKLTLGNGGNGNGTITGAALIPGDIPPTNGAMLNIGERYTVTARAAALSTFTEWISSTAPVDTDPTLTFIMESNLELTAVFAAVPPVVAISSPVENQRTTAPVFDGTAHGHFPITNVVCELDGTNHVATLSAGSGSVSNWSVTLVPSPGTNTFTVYAEDIHGVASPPVSHSFFFKVPALLIVTNAGLGTGAFRGSSSIAGDTVPADGAMLNIGEGYTITAIPGKSSLFSNWTSVVEGGASAPSASPVLRFVMQSDLVLTATFISNFFPAVAGTYDGLFYPASGVTEETSGMLYNLALRDTGAFSGQILTTTTNYHFATNFDAAGNADFKAGSLQVALKLETTASEIVGTVSSPRFSANLTADLASNVLQPASYTLLFSPTTDVSPVSPSGEGYALVTNKSGSVTLSGALADGTAYSQVVPVSQNGYVPVYASLYTKAASTNAGLLLGWINLTNLQATAPANALTWIKKPFRSPNPYTNGFTNLLGVQGGIWSVPPPGTPAISLTNGQLLISNASLVLDFTNVVVNDDNSLTSLAAEPTNSLSGSINPQTGRLTVTIANDDGGIITNYGAVVQTTTNGGGYFLTSTNGGSMILEP